MKFNSIKEMTLFEHQFWLQVLGDHSRFIFDSLSPKEKPFIEEAKKFINIFDDLLKISRKSISEDELSTLNRNAYEASIKLRQFKLNIIAKQIVDKITISLPPTFINHMVNELEEYLFNLVNLLGGNDPKPGPIHLHLLWLPDGSGHAAGIASELDPTEKDLIKLSKEYVKEFDNLYLKVIEYNGYTRTGICNFNALKSLNIYTDRVMSKFKKFLKELQDAVEDNRVLGTLTPLLLDHMFREECYYLTKLSMVSEISEPECDPRKPRVES